MGENIIKNERAFWGLTKNALKKKEGKWSKNKNERAAPSNVKIWILAPSIYIGLLPINYVDKNLGMKSARFSALG